MTEPKTRPAGWADDPDSEDGLIGADSDAEDLVNGWADDDYDLSGEAA